MIAVPVRQVTAVTFAGEDFDELIITTSSPGFGPEADNVAGARFHASPGVRGQAPRTFAG